MKIDSLDKVTVGLPVFNGEQFIKKRIQSILDQTYSNFELIISDNASTDSTPQICKDFAKMDNRIKFIRHEKNNGAIWNFTFLLNQAKTDYFVWASVDDIWHPEFLEKNIQELNSNNEIVGSISKVKYFEIEHPDSKSEKIDLKFRKFIKKIRVNLKPRDVISLSGSYDEKVKLCLKKSRLQVLYGIFRTDVLRKSIVKEKFLGNDLCVILNILKHGDFHVTNDILLEYSDAGTSKREYISLAREFNDSIFGTIFPWHPLTNWCIKNLGIKLFLKNLDYFLQLNLWCVFLILIDLIRLLVHKINRP